MVYNRRKVLYRGMRFTLFLKGGLGSGLSHKGTKINDISETNNLIK